MELFGVLKNLSKNYVSPIVQMFVCQAVKKDFDVKGFIEEQDLETLTRLYGDDCDEYSTDVSEEASNESNLDIDLLIANINNSQKWLKFVLCNLSNVLCNCNERFLAKIPMFMLPLHEIKLSPSASLCTPSKAEKRLLSLIKQFLDPPLHSISPTPFNFTYSVVK